MQVDDQKPGEAAGKPQLAVRLDGAAVIAWDVTRHDGQSIAVKVVGPSVRQMAAR
jgi:hypothetical protein